jgi:hypothetical protein
MRLHEPTALASGDPLHLTGSSRRVTVHERDAR